MHSFLRSLSTAEISKRFADSHPNRMRKVPGEKLTKSTNISLVACWILCPQDSWEINTIFSINRNLKERTMSGPPLFTAAQQAYPHYQPKNTLCQEKNNMVPGSDLWRLSFSTKPPTTLVGLCFGVVSAEGWHWLCRSLSILAEAKTVAAFSKAPKLPLFSSWYPREETSQGARTFPLSQLPPRKAGSNSFLTFLLFFFLLFY